MPPIWFKKKKPEAVVEIADLQNCGLEEVPKELFKYGQTLHTVKLNSNSLASLPAELYNMWKIKHLEVWDNDLEKISPDIGNLCCLTHLNISRNLLVELPLEMENCQDLVHADFSSNPLSTFPEDLTRMYQLRHLSLSDTNLDHLPRQLGRMSKLEVLELRENSLSDLPETISHMTLLLQLNIGCNQFEQLPAVVATLINLEELWADMNAFSTLPKSISNLAHLRVLDLSENRLLELPDTIGDLTQLTDLYLTDNHLTFLPETIGNLGNLQILRCERNKLMILPQGIGGLVNLSELNVSGNNLKMLPPSIGHLKNMTTFIAADNWLDYLPPQMGSCANLRIVAVQGNQLSSLPGEFCHLSQLSVLNIVGNRIKHLPFSMTALKNIKALWISSTQSKPVIELQTETDTKGKRLLTCVYFPQKESEMFRKPSSGSGPSMSVGAHGPTITFERKSSINFELSEEQASKSGHKSKEGFNYPKEPHINAVKKMSRELYSAMSDCSLTLSLSQTLSQTFSQDYYCPSPSPANFKMATQVMKLQNKEKRHLMYVKRNSLLKALDSDSSSVSSDGSFEELKNLQDEEEGSEKGSSTNPSTSTPNTQISLRRSPHASISEQNRDSSVTSRNSKRIEVPVDPELELMISTLEAEARVSTDPLKSFEPASLQLSIGGSSQATTVLDGGGSQEDKKPVNEWKTDKDDDTQTVSEFISYDSSPKTYKKKNSGSVPNVHTTDPSDNRQSHTSPTDQDTNKPFKLKMPVSKSHGSELVLNALQDLNEDTLSASASASRIDRWVREQTQLQHNVRTSKQSFDDSSILKSGSKNGMQETLTVHESVSGGSKQSLSMSNSSASESLPKSGHKQWYNSPQTSHQPRTAPNHSPFSSISQSSTDNSLSTSGGDRNGHSSPPSTQKEPKRRPNSNLSRDSGYTSKEYVMMDPYTHHMSSSRAVDRNVRTIGPHSELRRSPTEPISSDVLNRKAEFFKNEYPSNVGYHQPPRRISTGMNPPMRYPQAQPPVEKRLFKPRHPSTGTVPHTLNYDYNYIDHYYRHIQQPSSASNSPMMSAQPRRGYFLPQAHWTTSTKQFPHHQTHGSGAGFVAQLNKMSSKHSAKSAPLCDDRDHQRETFQQQFHGGVSMVGLNSGFAPSTEKWNRNPNASGPYNKKYSGTRHVRRLSTPFIEQAVIEAVITKSSPSGPLGITITGGISSQNLCRPGDPSLYILKLAENGPAQQCGKLQPGDRIIKVNGVEVQGFSQDQAAGLLKQTLKQVVILVSREVAATLL